MINYLYAEQIGLKIEVILKREWTNLYYPDEIINEVREKNDIVDVINESVGLQKSGSEWKCCCP